MVSLLPNVPEFAMFSVERFSVPWVKFRRYAFEIVFADSVPPLIVRSVFSVRLSLIFMCFACVIMLFGMNFVMFEFWSRVSCLLCIILPWLKLIVAPALIWRYS